jgi:periplasmic protein TonB
VLACRLAVVALAGSTSLGACRSRTDSTVTLPADANPGAPRRDEPPVALDAETPVRYPLALYQQRISGTVLLRLFVDETGKVTPESTRVQESSGYPALDSAALAAAPKLSYAPALRNGTPVATLFTQPIHFRHPDRGGATP